MHLHVYESCFAIAEFLTPDEILATFGLLNRRCHILACHHQLWEDRLQRLHPIIDLLDIQKGETCKSELL